MADFDPVSYMMGQKAAGSGGGGSTTLAGLTDVDISNPSDGQTLVYNSTSGKWENGAGGGGGASLVMPNISITMTGVDTATATCDMSRTAIMSAIENGAICIAKLTNNAWGEGNYRLASNIIVVENNEGDESPYLAVTSYEPTGGGDVTWYGVVIYDNEVICIIDRT